VGVFVACRWFEPLSSSFCTGFKREVLGWLRDGKRTGRYSVVYGGIEVVVWGGGYGIVRLQTDIYPRICIAILLTLLLWKTCRVRILFNLVFGNLDVFRCGF
jgi:hypothetical protein